MKCAIFLIILSVFILGAYAQEKTCKQLVSDITKRQLGGISKCTKSMKFKNGKDKAAKMTCILKCVMMAEGFLDGEGKMTKEQFDKFVDKELGPNLKEKGGPILETCLTKHAAALDPTEEFCKTYDPLIKCMLMAVGQMCPS